MSEPLNSAAEVWTAMKEHVTDTAQAGNDVVNALIDNLGYDADTIKASELGDDRDIKKALSSYLLHEEEVEDDGLDTWGDEIDEGDEEDDDY